MTTKTKGIVKDILKLSPLERANLVDHLLSSLDQPDENIDNLWRIEVEDRIKAYKSGKIKSVALEEVISKYRK